MTVAESTYQVRRDTFAAEEARLGRTSFRFSVFRGILFFAFVACLFVVLLRAGRPGWEWWAGAGFWLVAFLAVLPRHERVLQRQRRVGDLRRINEEALHRLSRSWADLPISSLPDPADAERPISRDLGLFGRASLWHLLGTAHTPPGKITLSRWLLEPAPPEEIARRQGAVAELAPEVDLRQQLEVRARPMEKTPPDIETFLRWAEGEPWLAKRLWLLWLARGLAVATVAVGVLVLATPLPASLFLLMVLVNLTVSYLFREGTEGTFNRVEAREDQFQLYAEALELIAARSYGSGELRHLLGDLTFQGKTAHRWMEILHSRVGLADARHNAYLHFLLQTTFLWDFHILHLLERWQREAGPHVRGWLAALGRFEALSALAMLRYDHPGWSFPSVAQGESRLAARELGHPLIPDGRRVTNDVEVGPAGTFLLVTGSNMSGKSTLLRSIGVNAVLAQAGGPVCAAALAMPPVTLATSILIEDSLEEGVSFFMAELQRIQRIVELSDRCHAEGRTLLYLLDEILRGTNSYERQVAVRRVVLHLLRNGALGAVSTHDLQLAEVEDLKAACLPVHFRETFHPGGDPPMTFDYQMRPGVATTVNALKLMELVGLKPE
jgi:hypothetical protein